MDHVLVPSGNFDRENVAGNASGKGEFAGSTDSTVLGHKERAAFEPARMSIMRCGDRNSKVSCEITNSSISEAGIVDVHVRLCAYRGNCASARRLHGACSCDDESRYGLLAVDIGAEISSKMLMLDCAQFCAQGLLGASGVCLYFGEGKSSEHRYIQLAANFGKLLILRSR